MRPPGLEKSWPPSPMAWRRYRVKLASGAAATLGFWLADPRHETTARLKEAHCASHLGLFFVLGDPESGEDVVLWVQQAAFLTLFSQHTLVIGAEVRGLLPRYFAAYFDEIKDLAPELARVRLIAPRTGDKTLN
jgi:hypothetical protein